ncbi:hypothetical protein [Bradyrhizobium sp. STM 3561]
MHAEVLGTCHRREDPVERPLQGQPARRIDPFHAREVAGEVTFRNELAEHRLIEQRLVDRLQRGCVLKPGYKRHGGDEVP